VAVEVLHNILPQLPKDQMPPSKIPFSWPKGHSFPIKDWESNLGKTCFRIHDNLKHTQVPQEENSGTKSYFLRDNGSSKRENKMMKNIKWNKRIR